MAKRALGAAVLKIARGWTGPSDHVPVTLDFGPRAARVHLDAGCSRPMEPIRLFRLKSIPIKGGLI